MLLPFTFCHLPLIIRSHSPLRTETRGRMPSNNERNSGLIFCSTRHYGVAQRGLFSDKEAERRVKAEFNIEGMHCDSCAVDIKETLEETAGVREADVTFKRKTAIVDFDEETVQQSTIVKKIQDLGYKATTSGEPQSEVGR